MPQLKQIFCIITVIEEEDISVQECIQETFKFSGIGKLRSLSDFPYKKFSGASQDRSSERTVEIELNYFFLGSVGQVDSAVLLSAISSEISPSSVFLVGVAGGRKEKVDHCDVVIASDVYFYETGKSSKRQFQSYNKNVAPNAMLLNWAKQEKLVDEWHIGIPSNLRYGNQNPKVVIAPIAAGEKVIIDSSQKIWKDIIKHSPKVVATEMEAFGCLRAAWSNDVPALVVRGVSDLLDDKENSTSLDKDLKRKAAAAAATFTIATILNNVIDNSEEKNIILVIRELSIKDADTARKVLEGILKDRCEILQITDGSIVVEITYQHDTFRILSLLVKSNLLRELGTKIDISGPDEAILQEIEMAVSNFSPYFVSEDNNAELRISYAEVSKILNESKITELADRAEFRTRVERYFGLVDRREDASRGEYRHFVEKEIKEQPEAIHRTNVNFMASSGGLIPDSKTSIDFMGLEQLFLIGSGSSLNACGIAKHWFESFAGISCQVDCSSEFRYRDTPFNGNHAGILVTQSGESADIIGSIRLLNVKARFSAAVVNVTDSTTAREADYFFPALAGREQAVVATKSFTCQLVVLAKLALASAVQLGQITEEDHYDLTNSIGSVSEAIEMMQKKAEGLKVLAKEIGYSDNILVTGRGIMYPVAQEFALKMSELAYIHSEAIMAGEFAHGPITLIDNSTTVIALAPRDHLFSQNCSNIKEVIAGGGKVIMITDEGNADDIPKGVLHKIEMPNIPNPWKPILYTYPAQEIAYQIGILRGTDVDQPRNLAKSVTVE